MADSRDGSSSQIDEVSSTDGPTGNTAGATVQGTTNGDSRESENGNVGALVTSTSSIKPSSSSYFPLRASLLGGASSSTSVSSSPNKGSFLNPARLSNPFAKFDKDKDKPEEECDSKAQENKLSSDASTSAKTEDAVANSSSKTAVLFVPLGGESSAIASTSPASNFLSTPSAPSLGFVFGQNIHEKVVDAKEVAANGTSTEENLFSAHMKKETDKNEKVSDSGGKTLSEAAREYEEARAVKRKFEEVQVITGEEEESNVLQINCKLFSWSSSSWIERGRGTLRVNDFPSNPSHHRLIVRSAGSLRVVLNTNIWSGMTVDRASNKSMRITAMDSNKVVKVFLVMASPKEMDQLQKCLEWRVNNLKKNEPANKKGRGDKEEEEEQQPELPPALDDNSFSS